MRTIIAAVTAMLLADTALAAPLLTANTQTDLVYGQLSQPANDDGSSNELSLPFGINFFGTTYNSFWLNNNGNITFGGPLSSYTPIPFPIASRPLIAPYWGDVDTRGTGAVYIGTTSTNNRPTVIATWNNVGYYRYRTDKTNDFQLAIVNRSNGFGTSPGDFDIEFRYNRLEWTTGDASGGSNGLGGTPAQAGYDAGDRNHFFTLPGSRTAAVLDLATTSNVSRNTPGLWRFPIRNGQISNGGTSTTPLAPVVVNPTGAFVFTFNVDLNQRVFIDPDVAVGYEYVVESGPLITTVTFPGLLGDPNGYLLYGWDGAGYNTLLASRFMPNDIFTFDSPVSRFLVRGISPRLGIDPSDPAAFVTGLTFNGGGSATVTQTPLTVFVPTPEPASALLFAAGLLGVGPIRRRIAARG